MVEKQQATEHAKEKDGRIVCCYICLMCRTQLAEPDGWPLVDVAIIVTRRYAEAGALHIERSFLEKEIENLTES